MGKGVATGRRRSRVSNAPEVYGELPMTCLAEEIETPGEGQVRALLTVASMRGFVTVEKPEEFQKWMDEQVAAAASSGEDDFFN